MGNRTAIPQQVHADDQSSGHLPCTPIIISGRPAHRTLEACERELIQYKAMEIRLRDALAESEARLRQKDELIQKQKLLKKEFDHRLLNDLQMTISLLSMQSRGSTNPEVASQLAVAANRVAMIARIHHRLNSYEGVQTIEFKRFLADFARDFSAMVSSHERPEQVVVEGIEINLPVATAIPLGFIASELITNAAKYGKGRIAIRLQPNSEYGYALSVSNDIVGVAAATQNDVLIAGVAGLVAGAMSMAAGEYVSVSSQSDTEKADIARECRELSEDPQAEHDELAEIYVRRGVDRSLAQQVAGQLMATDLLTAHARDELGISEITTARPVQAALTSAVMFSVGAAMPLLMVVVSPANALVPIVSAASLAFSLCWELSAPRQAVQTFCAQQFV